MELYDSRFVYFEWDDVLEGKDVFLADYISVLKDKVNDSVDAEKVRENDGGDFPFCNNENDGYTFAYYDPNYEVKKAYQDGKTIQYKYKSTEWKDWVQKRLPIDEAFEEADRPLWLPPVYKPF